MQKWNDNYLKKQPEIKQLSLSVALLQKDDSGFLPGFCPNPEHVDYENDDGDDEDGEPPVGKVGEPCFNCASYEFDKKYQEQHPDLREDTSSWNEYVIKVRNMVSQMEIPPPYILKRGSPRPYAESIEIMIPILDDLVYKYEASYWDVGLHGLTNKGHRYIATIGGVATHQFLNVFAYGDTVSEAMARAYIKVFKEEIELV